MENELRRLAALQFNAAPLPLDEYRNRIARACELMADAGFSAVYLTAGSSLRYFTGIEWSPSERLVGAVLLPDGSLHYVLPAFERGSFLRRLILEGPLHLWDEHESPFALVLAVLDAAGARSGPVGIDEATPCQHFFAIRELAPDTTFTDAHPVTAGCRMQKSRREIDLISTAMARTLEVHRSAAAILRPGIETGEVIEFIDRAHRAVGADGGSTFCAVQFGEATAYPHGIPGGQTLADGDLVLIDTGCRVYGYHSDITRTYVFGQPAERHREVWAAEKAAQATAFSAARLGAPCGSVDEAARSCLESLGYGPGYALPGLPHRTGHGIGLDIHEWPYLVRDCDTALDVGMCFSNEPMLCIDGEFGIRLEDHFYMTGSGPRWFTEPARSIDDPFGIGDAG